MRNILRFLTGGLILWTISRIFPSIVRIDDSQTLIIVLIAFWMVQFAILVVCFFILGPDTIFRNLFWTIMPIIAIMLSEVIALVRLGDGLGSFEVVGIWPKLLIATYVTLLFLKIPCRAKKEKTRSS